MEMGVDVGMSEAADAAHLSRAHGEARVMVTQDADYLNLHAERQQHSGIAYFQQGRSIGYIVSHLLLLHSMYSAEDMQGRLEHF